MKYSSAKIGRTFVIRLEQGDVLHEAIEQLAREEGVSAGTLIIVGGAEDGSRLVVGPRDGEARPVDPMTTALAGVHEVAGVGTIFPNEAGEPVLHMHMACGRGDATTTGCVRAGVGRLAGHGSRPLRTDRHRRRPEARRRHRLRSPGALSPPETPGKSPSPLPV